MELFSAVVQALTACAIVFAAWQLLFHSRQMHRDFEQLYVQRYWDLMDQRSTELLLRGAPTAEDHRVLRGYLQLCEDELDLRALGRVTDSTWAFWGPSMVEQCGASGYAAELAALPVTTYGRVRRLIAGNPDPLRWGWIRRKIHGL